jgi:hypothetical protein
MIVVVLIFDNIARFIFLLEIYNWYFDRQKDSCCHVFYI